MFDLAPQPFQDAAVTLGIGPEIIPAPPDASPLPEHPVLAELRRRAAVELFAWFEFTRVPGQFWAILDEKRDPASAMSFFVDRIGCDILRVRYRDPAEIEKVQTVIDLLTTAETLFVGLTDAQRRELYRHVFAGNYKKAREIAETFADLHCGIARARNFCHAPTIAAFKVFTGKLEALACTPSEITAARVGSDMTELEAHTVRIRLFRELQRRLDAFRESVGAWWPPEWRDAQPAEILQNAIEQAGEACKHIENDPYLTAYGIGSQLESLAQSLEILEDLRNRAGAGSAYAGHLDNGSMPSAIDPDEEARTEALHFFGVEAAFSPEELKDAYRNYIKNIPADNPSGSSKKHRDERIDKATLYWSYIDPARQR
ncbi:MAG: hypothetical protein ACREC6_09560 [Hyphomicrobiaceae bacterium]